MMNRTIGRFHLIIVLVLASACCAAGNAWRSSPGNSHGISLSLSPESAVYSSTSVPSGAVRFIVTVKNPGAQQITIAHPAVCSPDDYPEGSSRSFTDLHGRSEILLKITKPGGNDVILRDGPYFFDPGHVTHLVIEAGQTKQFELGWFFPNARGRWENSPEADIAFLEKGRYSVQLLYRNLFPKAHIYDRKEQAARSLTVWTGEAVSNVAEMTIY